MAEPTTGGASVLADENGAVLPAELARASAGRVGDGDSSAETDDAVSSVLPLLDDVDRLPLTDQVAVYETVHATLSAALTDEPG